MSMLECSPSAFVLCRRGLKTYSFCSERQVCRKKGSCLVYIDRAKQIKLVSKAKLCIFSKMFRCLGRIQQYLLRRYKGGCLDLIFQKPNGLLRSVKICSSSITFLQPQCNMLQSEKEQDQLLEFLQEKKCLDAFINFPFSNYYFEASSMRFDAIRYDKIRYVYKI